MIEPVPTVLAFVTTSTDPTMPSLVDIREELSPTHHQDLTEMEDQFCGMFLTEPRLTHSSHMTSKSCGTVIFQQ